MKLATLLPRGDDPRAAARLARSYEDAGVDVLAAGEAYGFDAVSWLGYLACATDRAELMAQILPIYARTPAPTPTASGTNNSLPWPPGRCGDSVVVSAGSPLVPSQFRQTTKERQN